jgi:hypothetical protein
LVPIKVQAIPDAVLEYYNDMCIKEIMFLIMSLMKGKEDDTGAEVGRSAFQLDAVRVVVERFIESASMTHFVLALVIAHTYSEAPHSVLSKYFDNALARVIVRMTF